MDENLPKFDIPSDFIVGNNISGEILQQYGRFPCKIKAGIFVLCIKGSLRATINLTEYTIGKNNFVILPPETFIQIHDISNDIYLYFTAFSSRFMESVNLIQSTLEYLPAIIDYPVLKLSEKETEICRDSFELLIKTDRYRNIATSPKTLRTILNLFLLETGELYRSQGIWEKSAITRNAEISRGFMQLVMQYYRTEHSVSFYAEKMRITLQHFCSAIKKATGKTALEIIDSVIIMDAKAQLKSTDFPIKEIAFSLGFTNLSFFNKYFKRHTNMTPQEYRNN